LSAATRPFTNRYIFVNGGVQGHDTCQCRITSSLGQDRFMCIGGPDVLSKSLCDPVQGRL